MAATVTNPTVPEIEQGAPPHRTIVTTSNPHSPHTEKRRLSAPQLQAQLSLLSDSTRLRRLKHLLHTQGAWQHVTRIEGLCHTHVSLEWLPHTRRGSFLDS